MTYLGTIDPSFRIANARFKNKRLLNTFNMCDIHFFKLLIAIIG